MLGFAMVRLEIVLWQGVMWGRLLCGLRRGSGILLFLIIIRVIFIFLSKCSMIPWLMAMIRKIVMERGKLSVSKDRKGLMRNCPILWPKL